ncbi:MAG: FAD:protein FMN transferase [Lachnospiraceae bacterium]|nr:FAD:protein FMN transferase [Lachnospiraceae bacterium]
MILIGLPLFLTGCLNGQPVSKYGFFLDTIVGITIYDMGGSPFEKGKNEEDLLKEAMSRLSDYEKLFSATVSGSDVSRINDSKGREIRISEETADIIEKALYYGELTDGAFDITLYGVSELWDFTADNSARPPDSLIEEAMKHVGYEKVALRREGESCFVKLLDPECRIDLGGIAKGYIGDRLKEFLIHGGVKSAVINLGGNVVAIGGKSDGSPFKIAIQKPFSDIGEAYDTLDIIDKSVVTSGSYQRYFEQDGKIYHHILDSKTGYPVESGLQSVTIISDKSIDGDALSTACFCLGEEAGRALLKRIGNVEAIFI